MSKLDSSLESSLGLLHIAPSTSISAPLPPLSPLNSVPRTGQLAPQKDTKTELDGLSVRERALKLQNSRVGLGPTLPLEPSLDQFRRTRPDPKPRRGIPRRPEMSLSLLLGDKARRKDDSFGVFGKFIDVQNGSLVFNGKASIHLHGVKFSSGEAIRILTNDLAVQEELGRGNYGTVSKALHQPTNVIMAMKEVKLELDEKKLRQILMELDVLHKCNSPFIVDFFGAFFVEGAVYMCIEYMDGGLLDQIYSGGLSEVQIAYVAECVVRGLKELKDRHNIMHRDVKPTNILVNTEGKVKLCDFGVLGNLVMSKARTQIGCQSYMPPERISLGAASQGEYTVQLDVWSLGLSLVEIAIGRYPYPPAKGIFEQLNYIVNDEPPTIPKNMPFSDDMRSFIRLCLSKKPELRPGYSELLEHPWLVKIRKEHFADNYKTMEQEFAVFVKQMLKKNEKKKFAQKETEYGKLNGSFR